MAGHKPGRPFRFAADWVDVVVEWVTKQAPRDFGFLRSRWCCEAVALLMLRAPPRRGQPRDRPPLAASRATWSTAGPGPIVGPKDPERQAKLDALRALLAGLPADETAVFQDEVDINTNPKIGSMWMVRGSRPTVETPGNNEKRYISGSIHWLYFPGESYMSCGQAEQPFGRGLNFLLGSPRA